MSLHYILDGYNIVKQIPELARLDLKSGRAALYRLIQVRHSQGSPRNKITIVFDGRADVEPHSEGSGIEVIFSRDRSADEEIKAMVGASPNPATIVLVSDDRQLKLETRSLGARIMAVSDFIQERRGKGKKPKEDKKEVSFAAEHKINAELRKIWLKK